MIGDIVHKVLPEMAADYRAVLKKWENRNLTPDFDIEICEVAVKHKDCMDDFRFRQLPTPPQEMMAYEKLSFMEKRSFLDSNKKFMDDDRIKHYLATKATIENANNRNKETLAGWLKLNISVKARSIVEDVLNTYSGHVRQPDWHDN